MHVVATAGHVDHGKSTLVRALTGIEPDRWEEERRRGLTIDLGYAWTTLDSGEPLAFVDVPGHERFIGNMLAGLGPVPAVLFVVAADEGWRQQSAEHLAAVDALGVAHGLLLVTRSDLADPGPALADARARLAATSLGAVEAVAVSARTGEGLPEVRAALSRLVAALPQPRAEGRTRLWVDRAFTIKGSGTVVTGTLGEGTIAVGDSLELGGRAVAVRSLQSLERPVTTAPPVCRVAANLRGLATAQVGRGDVLLTPGAWRVTELLDVRVRGLAVGELSGELVLHVGTAAVGARVRPLGDDTARLVLRRALPLVAGDRAILRDPGSRALAGALVLDPDPPALRRRGAAGRRALELEGYSGVPDLAVEVGRRGAMSHVDAQVLGVVAPQGNPPDSVLTVGSWYLDTAALKRWAQSVRAAVEAKAQASPLDPTMTVDAARTMAGVPDRSLMSTVVAHAGLELREGRLGVPGAAEASLGTAEAGLRAVEQRLAVAPFAAPERPELAEAGLGQRELAAAERIGRIVRLGDDVVLLPDGPARAMRELAALPQPFTLSQARQALGTTRRVAVPLLEHLDRRGWTRRVDAAHREVVR
ncbi:selenocysteine-specific translation elongation factor [Nostocoides sp. HKS02]|uniref:selenocysteine-specific translation elongation factor n=1 Tax=Nostocoides sp. HKS02 TaxID=1813880 RepID=UPI0012B4C278|nr:selenocysteine-specific translation elongation factor [Tetrasphaera sp. HKS02]QGN57682.1 selenocysteine-specific translation elongation factor [Tetrasphaera sp. HKS02]